MVIVPKPCLVAFRMLYIIVRYSMRWEEIGQGAEMIFMTHVDVPLEFSTRKKTFSVIVNDDTRRWLKISFYAIMHSPRVSK
jgi:hypothetical protein